MSKQQQQRLLVFGGKGWIGGMFTAELDKAGVSFALAESRADNETAVAAELDRVKPSHVVTLAGRTHGVHDGVEIKTIDYLERPGKLVENVRDNLHAPVILALLCQQREIHFTYLGTGCIFEYDEKHPLGGTDGDGFTEESRPNFFGSSYSTVKGFTDRILTLFGEGVLNLRIRMPITGEHNPRNFVTKITTYDKICSIPNSMSVLDELLPLMVKMIRNSEHGTFNFTNPGAISHNEILHMYKEVVDPKFTWKNFSPEEQAKILAAGRSNNKLETTKLTSKYPVATIHEAVRTALKKMQPVSASSKM